MDYTSLLTIADVQHLALVKWCWFLFVAGGLVLWWRRAPAWIWPLWLGITSALSYGILVDGLPMMFWGLKADEVTIGAMYLRFAHNIGADFGYAHLPPFYPALFFQIFGTFGGWLGWNGVKIAKFASAISLLAIPSALYWVQAKYWLRRQIAHAPGPLAWLLSALLLGGVFLDWDALITKPYEAVASLGVILWTVFLVLDATTNRWPRWHTIRYGVAGGILFLTFYFWFFLAAIGIGLHNVFGPKIAGRLYRRYIVVAAIVLGIGALYWLPLAISYHRFGSENWQLGFLHLPWLATYGLQLEFSVRGLLMLVGFVTLLLARRQPYMKILLSLWAAGYIWQFMGLTTISIWAAPLQESKGFDFFSNFVLLLAASYGLERAWFWVKSQWPQTSGQAVGLLALILLSPQLLFGRFADQPNVQATRVEAREADKGVGALAEWFLANDPEGEKVTLLPGIPQLPALVPVNQFLYPNQHNSHPAARWSERALILEQMASATSSTALAHIADTNYFGAITRVVCYNTATTTCPMYFYVDNFPHEGTERVITLPAKFFKEPEWKKAYESSQFIVFERR